MPIKRDKLGRFIKGAMPWCKGTKGICKPNKGSFQKGNIPWNKGIKRLDIKGNKNGRWIGGRLKRKDGYILIYKPNHPYCIHNRYILEHRLIIEKFIDRYLSPKEVVHHLNGKRTDNRPQNLIVFDSSGNHHRFERGCKLNPKSIIFDGRKLMKGGYYANRRT